MKYICVCSGFGYINHPGSVAILQVEQDGWLVKMGQHGHVLDLVKLGRIHGPDVIWLHRDNLLHSQIGTKVLSVHVKQLGTSSPLSTTPSLEMN